MPYRLPQLFPELTTTRLQLRKMEATDDKEIFALRSNSLVNEFIDRPKAVTINDAKAFIKAINEGIDESNWLYWAITLKGKQTLIGTICCWHFSEANSTAETGYELHPDYQGFGFMQEAMACIINYGFDALQLKAIEAFTNPNNLKSIRLLEKSNFTPSLETAHSTAPYVKYLLIKEAK